MSGLQRSVALLAASLAVSLFLDALAEAGKGPGNSAEFFVSPAGKRDAAGTRSDPWDLTTALKQPPAMKAGDKISLLGGLYGDGKTYFISSLTGRVDAPIVVRALPGQRATINGSLVVNGAYTWYRDLEITSSNTGRTGDQHEPAAGTLDGVEVNGPFTRFINLVVHDTREGFGLWTPAEGSEVYGCIIYNNGWQGPDRGHGHGIYTQNQHARKHLGDNIVFNQFGVGIHAYGSPRAFVENYLVDRNIVFNNGILSRDGRTDNLFFGAGGRMSAIRIESNYTYHTPGASSGTSRIGWKFGGPNGDVSVLNNYFIGGYAALEVWNWASLEASGNSLYSEAGINTYLQTPAGNSRATTKWNDNRHYGAGQLYFAGGRRSWEAWRDSEHLDATGTYVPAPPSGVWSFAHANAYEPGRGNLVIYNWDKRSSVEVNLSSILRPGTNFEIRDAQNFYGPPVVAGAYKGGSVRIPMTGLVVAQPHGAVPTPPLHTAPEFGTFVVLTR